MNLDANKRDGVILPITDRRIAASEWNQLVASCMAIIHAAGFTPDSEDNGQLLNAVKKIIRDLGINYLDVDLSNLSTTGRAKFDAKANATVLNQEISDRQSADTTLQNNINTEAQTRSQADTTLQGSIATEIASREAAVANLQSQIDELSPTQTPDDIATILVPDTSSRTQIQSGEIFTAPFAGWCIFQCDGSNDTDLYIMVNNVRVGGFSLLVQAGDEIQRLGVGSWPLYYWPCKGEANALQNS